MQPGGRIGAYGKVPAQADFLRLNISSAAAQGLITWLSEAVELLHGAALALPPRGLAFSCSAQDATVIGVLRESRDRVGRRFPLAVYAAYRAPELSEWFPGLPQAVGAFLAAAAELTSETTETSADPRASPSASALADRLKALRPPELVDLRKGFEAFVARARVEGVSGDWSEAVRVLKAACGTDAGGGFPSGEVTLSWSDAGDAYARFVWLALVRRRLVAGSVPSLLWDERRLLVSAGLPDAAALLWLCGEGHRRTRLWQIPPVGATDEVHSIDSLLSAAGG